MDFQELIDDLREKTGATRATLRLDRPGAVFPVVAESLAAGAASIAGETSIDLRASATFRFLDSERRNLIQTDVANDDVPPPPGLIGIYGVKAQMLAPVVVGDRMIGIVSVHYAPAVRRWTATDVDALDTATEAIAQSLAAA